MEQPLKDSIVAAVIAKFQQHSALGIAKYGYLVPLALRELRLTVKISLRAIGSKMPKKNSWSILYLEKLKQELQSK